MTTFVRQKNQARTSESAFTIVELLIVIVVIAILAAISMVAYSSIQDRAKESVVKSDLVQAAKQLAMDKAVSDGYPSTVNPDGSGTANSGKGLPISTGTAYQYTVNSSAGTFCLSGINGNKAYHIINGGIPQDGVCPGHSGPSNGGGETVVACASFDVGNTGPAGGIIFYKDTTKLPATCYEAAPAGWYAATAPNDPQAVWGCEVSDIPGAGGAVIGTGKQNTADILAANCSSVAAGRLVAAVVSTNFRGGNKSDWYLPSRDELMTMYGHRASIGLASSTSVSYLSSSEYGGRILILSMLFGQMLGTEGKQELFHVRPIRSFSD